MSSFLAKEYSGIFDSVGILLFLWWRTSLRKSRWMHVNWVKDDWMHYSTGMRFIVLAVTWCFISNLFIVNYLLYGQPNFWIEEELQRMLIISMLCWNPTGLYGQPNFVEEELKRMLIISMLCWNPIGTMNIRVMNFNPHLDQIMMPKCPTNNTPHNSFSPCFSTEEDAKKEAEHSNSSIEPEGKF